MGRAPLSVEAVRLIMAVGRIEKAGMWDGSTLRNRVLGPVPSHRGRLTVEESA
jgi:hypothetical protein